MKTVFITASVLGLGGLLLWPEWPAGNNGSPALFTLWLTASSIWFLREVCAVSRFHRGFDRLLGLWSLFGWLYPVGYILLLNRPALVTLHAYVFLSGLLGLAVWWAVYRGVQPIRRLGRALAERQRQHSTEILCAAVAPRSRPTLGEKVAGVFSVGILVVGFAVWIVPGAAEQVVGWLQ